MNCKHHNDTVATGTCMTCGQPLCRECCSMNSYEPMCWDCAEKKAREESIKTALTMVTMLQVSVVLMFLAVKYEAPLVGIFAAFGIPYGFRALERFGLEAKDHYTIFGVAAVFTIKIFLGCLLGPIWGLISIFVDIRRIVLCRRVIKRVEKLRINQHSHHGNSREPHQEPIATDRTRKWKTAPPPEPGSPWNEVPEHARQHNPAYNPEPQAWGGQSWNAAPQQEADEMIDMPPFLRNPSGPEFGPLTSRATEPGKEMKKVRIGLVVLGVAVLAAACPFMIGMCGMPYMDSCSEVSCVPNVDPYEEPDNPFSGTDGYTDYDTPSFDLFVDRPSEEEIEQCFLSIVPVDPISVDGFGYALQEREYDRAGKCESVVYSYWYSTPVISQKRLLYFDVYKGDSGWFAGENAYSVSEQCEVNIVGTWTYRDSNSEMWLKIHETGYDYVVMEYRFDYCCPGDDGSGVAGLSFSSDGEAQLRYTRYEGNSLVIPLFDAADAPCLYVESSGVICFDGLHGNRHDKFCLTREGDDYYTPGIEGFWNQTMDMTDQAMIWHAQPLMRVGGMSTDYNGNSHSNSYSHSLSQQGGADRVSYNLYGQYKHLSGTVHLAEGVPFGMNSVFRVYGNGILLYEFNANRFNRNDYGGQYWEDFVIDVSSVHELTLEFDGEYYTMSDDMVTYSRFPIFVSDLYAYQFSVD